MILSGNTVLAILSGISLRFLILWQRNKSASNGKRQHHKQEEVGKIVSSFIVERLHFRSPLSPLIATGFHGQSQVIGSSEGRNKEGHQNRHHSLCLVNDSSAFKIRSPGHLSLHNLIRFLHQNRNKTQCNGTSSWQSRGWVNAAFLRWKVPSPYRLSGSLGWCKGSLRSCLNTKRISRTAIIDAMCNPSWLILNI